MASKEWWLSVRDSETLTDLQRRNGDILFGVIVLFKFSKTHRKIVRDRLKSKRRGGLKTKHERLSCRLKVNSPKWTASYFTPHDKSIKGIMWWRKLVGLSKGKRRKQTNDYVKYGRRGTLIEWPRSDRAYRMAGSPIMGG